MTHRRVGPGHRHQPHGSIEVGQVEVDRGLAICVDLNDTREIGDQFFDWWCRFHALCLGIATAAQPAAHAQCTVYQTTVEIAHLCAQCALTEVVSVGCRSLEAR